MDYKVPLSFMMELSNTFNDFAHCKNENFCLTRVDNDSIMNNLSQEHAFLYPFRYFEVFYTGSKAIMLDQLVFLFNEFQNYPVDLSIWKKRAFLMIQVEISTSFWHITK